MYLKIKNTKFGVLESPRLPSTSMYQDTEREEYAVDGFKITSLVPLKKWRISYEGLMKEASNSSVTHEVRINGIWSTDLPHSDFDLDLEPSCLAKAVAREKWSRDYFKTLKKYVCSFGIRLFVIAVILMKYFNDIRIRPDCAIFLTMVQYLNYLLKISKL